MESRYDAPMQATKHPGDSIAPTMRIDKWLWAARFFKTRALAQEAVRAGRVRLNGACCKRGRGLRPGDRLTIQVEALAWSVTVLALTGRRGPATVARTLYEEDAESVMARQRHIEACRLAQDPCSQLRGRPTKRNRRLLHRFNSAD